MPAATMTTGDNRMSSIFSRRRQRPATPISVRKEPRAKRGHRQVDETLETKAARQASLDCRLDDLRREESEQQGHPDRTHSLALSQSNRLQSLTRIGQKFDASGARGAGLRLGSRGRWPPYSPAVLVNDANRRHLLRNVQANKMGHR
jgi:hypothetical protein